MADSPHVSRRYSSDTGVQAEAGSGISRDARSSLLNLAEVLGHDAHVVSEDTETFLRQRDLLAVIDVRSPGEFQQGHIDGAKSVPLFSDEERSQIGILYRQSGSSAAVSLGVSIAVPKIADLVQSVRAAATGPEIFVHCWRGGMRSEAVAQLLNGRGFEARVLRGGYKAFRHEVHRCFGEPRSIVILGGLTGTGKTRLLSLLRDGGEQVIDLEGLANHRGSAFGGILAEPQPTVEQFENDLFEQWRLLDPGRIVWIENESRKIGNVVIPEPVWRQMRQAPAIVVEVDRQQRLAFLLEEYCGVELSELALATAKIKKRLGGQRFQQAMQAISENQLHTLADILLDYYDKAYARAHAEHPKDDEFTFAMEYPMQGNRILALQRLGHAIGTASAPTAER